MPDYFDELLNVFEIFVLAKKRMYLRVREIFALAGDYDSGNKKQPNFFRQFRISALCCYRLHSPRLIYRRADHNQANMG